MKRQLTSILLFSALLVGGASTFVSCTDHESDSNYNTSVSLADAIKKQVDELGKINTWLGDLKTSNPDLAAAIDARIRANQTVIEDMAKKAILGQYADLDAAIKASKSYGDLDTKIGDIESLRQKDSLAFAKADSIMKDNIDSLVARVGNVETEQQAQKLLNAQYEEVFNALVNKKIDNVAINASENPVTGYWNAAFLGSQLNLASSFYGVAAQGHKAWGVEAGDVLGKNGNAGYIYISLNPTEVEPALIKSIKLVDSQGNEAKGFKLGEIENTDKVLTYGYTRTAVNNSNGFYQVPVIATDPQNDDFSLDKGSLKEAAQNILAELKDPKGNDFDLTKVAAALYKNNLNNTLKAYTVKIEYDLLQYDATTKKLTPVTKHAVAPTYNMAAFAIKPLSFNFLKDNTKLDKLSDWSMENLLLPTVSDKVNKYIKGIKFEVKYDGETEKNMYTILATRNFQAYQDGDDVVITSGYYRWDAEKQEYVPEENKRIPNATLKTYYSYQGQWIRIEDWHSGNQIYGEAYTNERLYVIETTDNTIGDLLASLNKQIEGKLGDIKNDLSKIPAKWDNVANKVNPLLKKVYSKIASANKLLQPTILYMDKNHNPNTLSTLGGRLGTRFVGTGKTTLYATSWTAELLAPAYLKSVYVKEAGAKVYLADGKTLAKTPFDGNKIIFDAEKAGEYTIVYKAIDYSGVQVEKEFHVVVK